MATIGILDSGVGGLSVFREIYKLLPQERFVYFSDNAYCPYGTKDASTIIGRTREITEFLLRKGVDIIVVACNTATAAAITALREEFSQTSGRTMSVSGGRIDHVRFIGMEPAVKPAALGTRSGVIGVLATAGTLKGSNYLKIKDKYEDGVRITEHIGEGFVELVENGDLDSINAMETVRASVEPLVADGADTIVLGCTHYPFLGRLIKEAAGEDVKIIDPAPAVARQLLNVMEEEGIPYGKKEGAAVSCGPDIEFETSGPDDALKRMFSRLYL